MYNRDHFSNPPGRRFGALALFLNRRKHALIVEKKDKTGPARWGLPGGCAEENEDVRLACQREVKEETGLSIPVPQQVLAVHQMLAEGDSKEGVNFVFDCGLWPEDTQVTLGRELISYRWVPRDVLPGLVAPYTKWRVTTALDHLDAPGPGVLFLVGHVQPQG